MKLFFKHLILNYQHSASDVQYINHNNIPTEKWPEWITETITDGRNDIEGIRFLRSRDKEYIFNKTEQEILLSYYDRSMKKRFADAGWRKESVFGIADSEAKIVAIAQYPEMFLMKYDGKVITNLMYLEILINFWGPGDNKIKIAINRMAEKKVKLNDTPKMTTLNLIGAFGFEVSPEGTLEPKKT